jgi:hypothetical protein
MLDPGRQRPMLKAVQPGVKLQLATCEKAQAQGEQEAGVFILRSWQNLPT